MIAVLFLGACSTHPTLDERITANELAIKDLQNKPVDTSCPQACNDMVNEKVDRAFEKSQYK